MHEKSYVIDLNSHADEANIIKLAGAHITGVSGNFAEKYFFRHVKNKMADLLFADLRRSETV